MVFSPDGERLAMALTSGPVVILNTATGETEREIKFDPFLMRFSANGRQILAVMPEQRNFLIPNDGTTSVVKWDVPLGYLGCGLKQKSGKLLIDSLTENGPAAAAGNIQIGDELVALVIDGRELSTLGKSEAVVLKSMNGPIGTPIVLRIMPKGSGKKVDVELRRKPATLQGDGLVFREYGAASSPQVCIFGLDGNLLLQDANNGDILSIIHPIECAVGGSLALSGDGHQLAVASLRRKPPRSGPDLGLEVFDVERQERTHFIALDTSRIDETRFSSDGNRVLIAGFDRILVYDLQAKQMVAPILVGFDPKDNGVKENNVAERPRTTDAAAASIVNRARSNLGLGGKSRIESSSQLISSFDASADGTFVAVGGMHGNCTLWSVKEHRKLAEIGEPLTKFVPAKKVILSQDGRWVAYFAEGTLNIASVKDAIAGSAPAPAGDPATK